MAKLLKTGDRSFTADSVRLIGVDGEQLDIVSLAKAREFANAAHLDLVLMSEKTVPPVVRIMDFGKLQYEQKKSLKAQRKNSLTQKLKEVKFHMNIDDHDYKFKLKHAVDFLQKGCRLKATLVLRGREMAHKELADELMEKIVADISPFGEADGKPKMLGKSITVIFAQVKTSKKGGGGSSTAVAESMEEVDSNDEMIETVE